MWQGGEQLPPRPCSSPLPPVADAQLQACHAAGRGGAGASGGWQRLSRQRGGEVCPGSSILPLSILPSPPPHPLGPACNQVGSGSRVGSQARPGCPQGCAGSQPKCGTECAWTIVLHCGSGGAASTHHRLARAGGEGCPGPHLLMQPRVHWAAAGREAGGSDVRPPMVRWQVLLLPRWGFGRGRGRC